MQFNKKIIDIKLAITTDCVLRCAYCLVKKDRRYMSRATAINTIDFFLSSPGKEKILRIYGGEPLLHFRLIRELVPYAIRRAKINKKNLIIAPCTNATLLTADHVDFFKKYDLRLAVTIDGNKKIHDAFRRYKKQTGSYDRIRKNIPELFRKIKKQNLGASLNVAPTAATLLFSSFQNILKLGFDTVNIEPIHDFQTWTLDHRSAFMNNMKKIITGILKGIEAGNFIFLATINRELKHRTLSKSINGVCHFSNSLEIGPDGEMAFSSILLNSPEREKYIIGYINDGVDASYLHCKFKSKDKACLSCRSSYFDRPDSFNANAVVRLRNLISIHAAQTIQKLAGTSPRFADYITAAKQHICF